MNPKELLQRQLELECIAVDKAGRLFRMAGPDPDDIARVYFVKLVDGEELRFYREDVYEQAEPVFRGMSLADIGNQEEMLRASLGSLKQDCFFSYIFPTIQASAEVGSEVSGTKTRHEILEADRIIAFCESSRENAFAAEAWVFVEPNFRNRGLAKKLVMDWAGTIARKGKTAFYSHRADNVPSQKLADSLGLDKFAEVFAVLD